MDAAVIHTLATCERLKKGLPLCLIGDSGTRKSHLLIALGTEAAMAGVRVRYTLATKLVNALFEAADEKILTETIARYGRVDLLCMRTASPSPPTSRSVGGPKRSPIPDSARPSSTASPSAGTSPRPARNPTDSPAPGPPGPRTQARDEVLRKRQ
ncbi:ATP-binding protein [Streptomyces capitiformicae]|uniref:ATP-binding protein n=1 Tax=Streptomyces capitiformicae TaxID=2014920 RepID=UPI0040330651